MLAADPPHVSLPVGVGFGIRDARARGPSPAVADAVVIGSRIIQEIERPPAPDERGARVRRRLSLAGIRAALDGPSRSAA